MSNSLLLVLFICILCCVVNGKKFTLEEKYHFLKNGALFLPKFFKEELEAVTPKINEMVESKVKQIFANTRVDGFNSLFFQTFRKCRSN